jgi:hypothetical protein
MTRFCSSDRCALSSGAAIWPESAADFMATSNRHTRTPLGDPRPQGAARGIAGAPEDHYDGREQSEAGVPYLSSKPLGAGRVDELEKAVTGVRGLAHGAATAAS